MNLGGVVEAGKALPWLLPARIMSIVVDRVKESIHTLLQFRGPWAALVSILSNYADRNSLQLKYIDKKMQMIDKIVVNQIMQFVRLKISWYSFKQQHGSLET